jgi:2'-5' RNA ligase
MRLFYAARLPEQAIAAVRELAAPVKERGRALGLKLRWLQEESLHITLCFLGEQPESLLSGLGDGLVEACAQHRAPRLALATGASAIGTFAPPSRSRVLVAHLSDPNGELSELAADLSQCASRLGIQTEARAFRPHVTIARCRPSPGLKRLLESNSREPETRVTQRPAVPKDFAVTEICLMSSTLAATHAMYSVQRSVKLPHDAA